ncbi:MAG: saccharopine dehydrogenase family protein [Thermovirgaceae bacterium]
MKALVLGAGLMGRVVAKDLVESPEFSEVTLGDVDEKLLKYCENWIGSAKLKTKTIDASDESDLKKEMEDMDIAAIALPNRFSLGAVKAAIKTGTHAVDLVGVQPEKRLALDDEAKKAGVLVIPGLGVAPGLTNVLVGHAVESMDKAESAVFKVGGLPVHPEPPLDYKVVFCFSSVIEACKRKVLIIKDGKLTEVEPLSGVETITLPEPLGECECFYTDGLSTLPLSLEDSGIQFVAEKTIRYPGWCDKLGLLREIGLLDDEPVDFNGCSVSPARFLTKLLDPKITLEEGEPDLTILQIDVVGEKDGRKTCVTYEMLDFFDEKKGITSMGKTTSFPCSSACRMIARGDLALRGVVPPEKTFTEEQLATLLEDLKERGVVVKKKEKAL